MRRWVLLQVQGKGRWDPACFRFRELTGSCEGESLQELREWWLWRGQGGGMNYNTREFICKYLFAKINLFAKKISCKYLQIFILQYLFVFFLNYFFWKVTFSTTFPHQLIITNQAVKHHVSLSLQFPGRKVYLKTRSQHCHLKNITVVFLIWKK